MIKKSILLLISYFLLIFGVNQLSTFAQTNPTDLFDEYCADCHSIGEGDMKGPDLIGVERKYSEEWLVKFILSAKTMINSGDQKAVKIWEKYEKKKMPDTKLSEAEIISLIDYIRSLNKSTVEVIASTSSIGNNQTNEILTAKVNENEIKLQNIEKKIDLILEFHKKSFSARITDEEINKGRELF